MAMETSLAGSIPLAAKAFIEIVESCPNLQGATPNNSESEFPKSIIYDLSEVNVEPDELELFILLITTNSEATLDDLQGINYLDLWVDLEI